jgi:hypothetical protein
MHASDDSKPGNEEETIDLSELETIHGGVMPMWTADGKMVTCTDPLRWTNPRALYPSPFPFRF